MVSPLGRIQEGYKLIQEARTRLPVACGRLFDDYLAGYPSGGDSSGGTLIDPRDPSQGSISLTQPERFGAHHDDAARARRELTAATYEYLAAAQTISNIAAQWGKYNINGKILEPHELDSLRCVSCKRIDQHQRREPHKKMCSWCEDWNIKANAERLARGKEPREMPPINLVRKRYARGKGRITRADMVECVKNEPASKKKKKRKTPAGSFAHATTRADA